MVKSKKYEKQLNAALETAAKDLPELCRALLTSVGENDDNLRYHWSRSENPWYRGWWQGRKRDSETDILIVFESHFDKSRFALHIENKVAADFQPDQPELYHTRGQDWIGLPKWGNYQSFKTLLIAPAAYLSTNTVQAKRFDGELSHEEISQFVIDFA